MKKLKVLSVIAAAALMFTAMSCNSDEKTVEEAKITGITVNADSATKLFFVGDDFSYENLIVKATYSDNSKKTVNTGFSVALSSNNLDENSKIKRSTSDSHREIAKATVTYEGLSASYDVTISDVVSKIEISVDDETVKTSYNVGDDLDTTGVSVKAFYSDDDTTGEDITQYVTISAGFTSDASIALTDFNTAVAGTYTLKFTASYNGKTAESNSVDITVSETSQETAYEVSFSKTNNSSTYSNGVYTLTIVDANEEEWGNQIFIKNPNSRAGVEKGNRVLATITAQSDKDIREVFFKNQYNGGTYSGNDTSKALKANEETVFNVVGTVADDYDDSSSFVIALRGNEANTTLILSNIKTEVLGENYEITDVSIEASPNAISAGETSTITLKDQYGFAIADATYEITSTSEATLVGNVLTAGDTSETVTVKATYGNFEKTVTIEITAEKNYAKYWNVDTRATKEAEAPIDYFSIWADNNWCGSTVTLSNMTATENSVSLTQTITGSCWHGTQIWYALSANSKLTFKVTSTVAGDITVNGTVYSLIANTPQEITVDGTEKLAIRLGQESANTQLGDCTFSITDFVITAK